MIYINIWVFLFLNKQRNENDIEKEKLKIIYDAEILAEYYYIQ